MFIAVCCGQVSKYIICKKLKGTVCPECNGIFSTYRVLYEDYVCSYCKVEIQGDCPKRNVRWTDRNRLFVDKCRKLTELI